MRRFNLSLDDMSPHPKAGLNFEAVGWCDKLIQIFPSFKVNLFVPSAYCRLGEMQAANAIVEHKDWVRRLNSLPRKNYRINFHGVHHSRQYWPRKPKHPLSNNDEWQYLSYDEALVLIKKMVYDFNAVGLRCTKTFRPPGWKISKDAVRALNDNGFVIAGSEEYKKKVKSVLKSKWISYNWDMTAQCTVDGDVVAYGHTSSWTNNYMDEDRFKLLVDLLSNSHFKFEFIEDM